MGRMCDRCDGDIKTSYLLKQNSLENIVCPNCGRILKVTKTSKVAMWTSYILMLSIFVILPIKLNYKIIIEGIWTLLSYYLLQSFVYTYKEIEE